MNFRGFRIESLPISKTMTRYKILLILTSPKSERKLVTAEDHREMRELVRSVGGEIIQEITAPLERPHPKYYVGEGKAEEIRDLVIKTRFDAVIFNVDLSPSQNKNLEKFFEDQIRVVDRTGLILDIFALRAHSKEGRLQVELAQLEYLMPRLVGAGGEMSRLGGGIGTRGPGEQKLEVDRRRIRDRIQKIKNDLKDVETHRNLLRMRRRHNRAFQISLIGYTNAGKTTLLNSLTNSDGYTADKLFATLDPMTRILKGKPTEPTILFTDTVGFISRLPHELVDAFHATLEEVIEADLLLHVIDGASPFYAEQIKVVEGILAKLKCEKHATFMVFNKEDLLNPVERASYRSRFPYSFLVSAKTREGLESLQTEILEAAKRKFTGVPPIDLG